MKLPNFMCPLYGVGEYSVNIFSSQLRYSPVRFNPRKFLQHLTKWKKYYWIRSMKFETVQIHLLSDVFSFLSSRHFAMATFSSLFGAVIEISSCHVNTTSRQGIKQLGISFDSIFLLFSYGSSEGSYSWKPKKIPNTRPLMTTLLLQFMEKNALLILLGWDSKRQPLNEYEFKYTKQNIFVTVSQLLNPLVAFKGHFADQNDRYPHSLFTSSSEFPTLVSYTEVWKRWAEPPCIGHYRECPPPASPQTNNGVMKGQGQYFN